MNIIAVDLGKFNSMFCFYNRQTQDYSLANAPTVLLADEPTGNLDPHTAQSVFESLERLVRESGLGGLVATHNFDLAARMDRTLRLEDGLVVVD